MGFKDFIKKTASAIKEGVEEGENKAINKKKTELAKLKAKAKKKKEKEKLDNELAKARKEAYGKW